ncbi:interferon regulatory factor 9 isoform X2 [Hippopotamus amphibius kiboko]|uniref:interferon regulatory factor 9 isoform X2 n=1 Tax=Hippopotamus amphibius kiboko TaxID=575201 RepID=UPI0025981D54|nr:interferon regulatory factor 9 isoform X2 [Hippopotamus amphibius kiboko]XP_057579120.1 interferon regulatory factor 9 isoform X2 [Hippopotamus amphibius kiboko]
MASGRARCTRKLRNWVVEQVESGQFPGVCWDDAAKTMFRIPWKHAGKQDFREDQDAAFFKAWAIFKGKYKEGNSEGPAIWKTRLRCALNKSSEFEEVPENGHRDGAEPYKVYRLLPPGALPTQSGTQKAPAKRHHSSVSSERKEDEVTSKNCTLSPSLLQDSPKNELVETNGAAGHSDVGSSSSSSNSPEPQEGRDTAEAPFQENLVSLELLPPPGSDYSLLLTFIYDGHVVGKAQVQSLDCRLVAEPSVSQCGMEQVIFPKPGPREPTQRLLSQLKRGVLVASNSRGVFVQRLCPIPISWNAPQAPPGPGPHLLPSNECVELFRTTCFCRDLARYFQGLGPPPEFQVTLNFWEESPGPNHTPPSLITVQMEQAFARHLLKKMPEEQAATLSLVQSLEDLASSSPLCSSYLL